VPLVGDVPVKGLFQRLATRTARAVGHPAAFAAAVFAVLAWAVSGRFFGFSDTWQLVINTGTTIVTFLIVFLIQSTQNRDSQALHLKLDELIKANERARNGLIALEDMDEDELASLQREFERVVSRRKGARREHA